MRARSIIYEPTHCSAHGRAPDGAAAASPGRGGQPSASPASGLRLLRSDPEWRRKAA